MLSPVPASKSSGSTPLLDGYGQRQGGNVREKEAAVPPNNNTTLLKAITAKPVV
jgi:hypothetical protein